MSAGNAVADFAAGYRSLLNSALDQIDTEKVALAIDWLRQARDNNRAKRRPLDAAIEDDLLVDDLTGRAKIATVLACLLSRND